MGTRNSGVEYAIERNSWGKSRNELLCRFHNSGGLHRFSGDAPLETQILIRNQRDDESYPDIEDPPPYCHTYKAATPLLLRTREAAIAYKKEACKSIKRNTKHKRERNANKKSFKQKKYLKNVMPPSNLATSNVKFLTIKDITKRIVVCDGGKTDSDGIRPTREDIYCLRIRDGDLWVADTCNSSLGLHHIRKYDTFPTFIRLPRRESLQILNDSRESCNAMRLCALTQRQSLTRGKQQRVYSNSEHKYCCVGVQPGRNVRGVISGHYRIQQGFPSKQWDILHNTLNQAEHVFDKYVNTDVICHVTCAKSRIKFATMVTTASSVKSNPTRYYSGLVVQAHLDTLKYKDNDPVICYFAFPRLGMAIALRPGDFLLFNPQEHHCISSRCQNKNKIYSMSSYLKTAIVGLNDNSNTTV